MHSLAMGVAGLQAIEGVGGVENLNLSDSVSGHLRYPSLIGKILHRCGFIGIKVNDEIEKDDVIKMKEEYAAGHITDLDESGGGLHKGNVEHGVESTSKDMRGLSIAKAEGEVANPPLPRRPVPNRAPPAPQEEGLISLEEPTSSGSASKHQASERTGGDFMKPLVPERRNGDHGQ